MEVLLVVSPNSVDVLLKLSGLLELLIVALTLDATLCSEHDILVGTIDILLPHGKPRCFVVMLDGLPSVSLRRCRYCCFRANVYSNHLWCNSPFNFASLWMLTATTE